MSSASSVVRLEVWFWTPFERFRVISAHNQIGPWPLRPINYSKTSIAPRIRIRIRIRIVTGDTFKWQIIHQDLWWGKLVPSPYKRSELSNRVFCSFSSRKESICKWIPISNSLGKEAALVNVSISKGGLKCQRVVISDMPNWGDKVIRRYTGCTLQTFVKHYDSTISPPFFQRFPL